jgi:hypothetical protein
MDLWRWYTCYRALVRAKVAALQADGALHTYVELAERLIARGSPLLAITTGVSGLGKSRCSLAVAERLGWIRLRSDVERKRAFGLWGIPQRAQRLGDPYAPAVREELFGERLPALADQLIRAGFPVVVDATFLRRTDRRRMALLAAALGAVFLILAPQGGPAVARARIRQRRLSGGDPSDADEGVLERQLMAAEPLGADEVACSLALEADLDPGELAARVRVWCGEHGVVGRGEG